MEQKEAEVGELQRRLLGMQMVIAGVLLFSTWMPRPEGVLGLAEPCLLLAAPGNDTLQLHLADTSQYLLAFKEPGLSQLT